MVTKMGVKVDSKEDKGVNKEENTQNLNLIQDILHDNL